MIRTRLIICACLLAPAAFAQSTAPFPDAARQAIGTPEDAPYAGVGNGSQVAIGKGLFGVLSGHNAVVSRISGSIGTTSTPVVPGPALGAPRFRAVIYNLSPAGTLFCAADGLPAAVNAGVAISPNAGAYEWDFPAAGAGSISCISPSGTIQISGEYTQ